MKVKKGKKSAAVKKSKTRAPGAPPPEGGDWAAEGGDWAAEGGDWAEEGGDWANEEWA